MDCPYAVSKPVDSRLVVLAINIGLCYDTFIT
jgi:hypothetical protein